MLERLRVCMILANHCDVTRPSNWGAIGKEHKTMLETNRYKLHLQPVLDRADQDVGKPLHKLYVHEKYLHKHVCDGKKVPSLLGDTSHFMDPKLLAEKYFKRIEKEGELTKIVSNVAKQQKNRKKLIFLKY